jgi:hypothetical protein
VLVIHDVEKMGEQVAPDALGLPVRDDTHPLDFADWLHYAVYLLLGPNPPGGKADQAALFVLVEDEDRLSPFASGFAASLLRVVFPDPFGQPFRRVVPPASAEIERLARLSVLLGIYSGGSPLQPLRTEADGAELLVEG